MKNVKINIDFFEAHKNANYKVIPITTYIGMGAFIGLVTGFCASIVTRDLRIVYEACLTFGSVGSAGGLLFYRIDATSGKKTVESGKSELEKFKEYLKEGGINTTTDALMNAKIIMENTETKNGEIGYDGIIVIQDSETIYDRVFAIQNSEGRINLIRQKVNNSKATEGIETKLYDELETAEFIEKNKIKGYTIK